MGHLLSFAPIFAILILLRQWSINRRFKFLPPGPQRLPLVGNMFNWPLTMPWIVFEKWAQTYGDIFYGNAGGIDIIVVSSHAMATALLQDKSANYSDRPSQHFVGRMVGWESCIVMLPDGAELNEQRRLFMPALGTRKAIQLFEARTEARIAQFVKRLIEAPNPDVLGHSQWLSGAAILDVTFGYEVSDRDNDEFLVLARQIVGDFGKALVAGAYLVDVFPWLEKFPSWLPGMTFLEEARSMRTRLMRFVHEPFEFAKNEQSKGTGIPCMVGMHLEDKSLTLAQESTLKWSASGMYAGGTDTTASAVTYFALFMLQYPNVQARAQAELDALLGGTRLPTARDMDALPYIRALVSEVLRFGPIAPHGGPRLAREDDMHDGYLIPKGTIVLPNIYFISRDPRNYNNPHTFNPDRFLGPKPELDPRKYVFGFGRRICPGRLFAENNIFVAVATCLATITFKRLKDKDGNEIIPEPDFGGPAIAVRPERFSCRVVPRSEHSITLLQSTDT